MVYQLKYQELNDEFEERKVHRQVLKAGEQPFNEGLPQNRSLCQSESDYYSCQALKRNRINLSENLLT